MNLRVDARQAVHLRCRASASAGACYFFDPWLRGLLWIPDAHASRLTSCADQDQRHKRHANSRDRHGLAHPGPAGRLSNSGSDRDAPLNGCGLHRAKMRSPRFATWKQTDLNCNPLPGSLSSIYAEPDTLLLLFKISRKGDSSAHFQLTFRPPMIRSKEKLPPWGLQYDSSQFHNPRDRNRSSIASGLTR